GDPPARRAAGGRAHAARTAAGAAGLQHLPAVPRLRRRPPPPPGARPRGEPGARRAADDRGAPGARPGPDRVGPRAALSRRGRRDRDERGHPPWRPAGMRLRRSAITWSVRRPGPRYRSRRYLRLGMPRTGTSSPETVRRYTILP